MGRECVVCSPEIYNCEVFQKYIDANCQHVDKQWIYNMIYSQYAPSSCEKVYYECADYILARDIHPGQDTRYLVIFKDTRLRTIRDLRGGDVPLLRRIHRQVARFVRERHRNWPGFGVFFHYHPSVYQLHAHICVSEGPGEHAGGDGLCLTLRRDSPSENSTNRRHHMAHVIRNLGADGDWYKHALILTSINKYVRHLNLHTPVE